MSRVIPILLTILVASAPAASAEDPINFATSVDSASLRQFCTSSEADKKSFCLGFIGGVLESYMTLTVTRHEKPKFCIREGQNIFSDANLFSSSLSGSSKISAATEILVSATKIYRCQGD